MSAALLVACILLAIAYGSVCIYSTQQLIRVHHQDELSCSTLQCWFPRTIQRQVQVMVAFLTATRTVFFVVAIFAWDSALGEVDNYRGAFYSLDELATIAFFSLACVLALFWAEVYYIAIDQVQEYKSLIRPMTYAINIGAYIAVIGCAYAAVHASSEASSYIYWNFSLLVSILFGLAALIFTFFAYKAASEIAVIPVHLTTRQERTEELSRIFSIFILTLLARAACLLLMSNDDLSTDSTLGIVLLSLYFVLLELLPVVFAIIFYRTTTYEGKGIGVYSQRIRFEDVMASLEETEPLSGNGTNMPQPFSGSFSSGYSNQRPNSDKQQQPIIMANSPDEQLAVETLLNRINGGSNHSINN
jgi:hypothetical protein